MKKLVMFGMVLTAIFIAFFACDVNDQGEFTVTFDADGGEIPDNYVSVIEIKVESGKTIDNLPYPVPQVTGIHFDGWYTQKNGAGDLFDSSTIVTSNMTVFAKWGLHDCDGGNPSVPPSLYWGLWENNENQRRIDLSGVFYDNYGSHGGYVSYKVKNGSDWVDLAFGTLSIITNGGHGSDGNVIFIVTHKWILETSSFSNEQNDLDTLLEHFGGSLILNGKIDGSNIGSVIDFNDFLAFEKNG